MRGLLFDKDGTLIDFEASWGPAYRELSLHFCNGDMAGASAMLTAGGMDPSTGKVRSGSVLAAGNARDIAEFWFPSLFGAELRRMVDRIDQAFYENAVRCSVALPGVSEALARLGKLGWSMGVATSDGTAGTRAALAALGLDRHLAHVFGYDAVERPKPAPDIVYAFAAAIGAEPAEIAVIGDNRHDLEMARSAGAGAAIGVLSGTSRAEDLAPFADILLDSVCDLPACLGSPSRDR
jgi:phosphoglycolate phosphatase